MSEEHSDPEFTHELRSLLTAQGFLTLPMNEQEASLLASRDGAIYVLLIRVGPQYAAIDSSVIEWLKETARDLGGNPRIAVRQYGSDWTFLYIDELRVRDDTYEIEIPSGAGYGLSIDEL